MCIKARDQSIPSPRARDASFQSAVPHKFGSLKLGDPLAPTAKRSLRIVGGDWVVCVVLLPTVLGWSLTWACALSLVRSMPVWLAALIFLLGLALIPLRSAATPRPR